MSTELTTREAGDVIIVDMSGRLTLGEGTSALRNRIQELLNNGSRRILLDMADVSQIDSAGLGELVAGFAAVAAAGGELKLVYLARHAHDLMEITKLYTVFETYEDEKSAIATFPLAKQTELQARWARFMRRITTHSSRGKSAASPQFGWDDDGDLLPGMSEIQGHRS